MDYESIFIARQPIFDVDQEVWGYELLFRQSGDAQTAQITDQDQATSSVIIDGLSLALQDIDPDKKALINFPANMIRQGVGLALPKEQCIIEILETVDPEPEIIQALQDLKKEGFTLALDDYIGEPGFEPFIELADIIKVEVMGVAPVKIPAMAMKLKNLGCQLLAEKVEDEKMYNLTKKVGFTLFQGYYFSKPEIVPGRKIAAGAAAKVQLLKALSSPDIEVDELAKIVETDPSLSYRLLMFINSTAFSLRAEVSSLQQAISLLGIVPFKKWSMVLLLSEMNTTPKGAEMAFTSLVRASFLERLVDSGVKAPYPKNTMFLLGLLSALDALLQQEMSVIIENMPLDKGMKAALCGEENEVRGYLNLLFAVERGEWPQLRELLLEREIDFQLAAKLYREANTWAKKTLAMSK